jgi:hypothetical protein
MHSHLRDTTLAARLGSLRPVLDDLIRIEAEGFRDYKRAKK